jgi:hypothetical protein
MVKYTVRVKNKGDNKTYSYSLELSQNQEDNPQLIFTKEITSSLQINLERQSSAKITEPQLQQIINAWFEDIREGYRDTQITLNLKSALEEKIILLEENGNQEIPDIIDFDLEDVEPVGGMLPPLDMF